VTILREKREQNLTLPLPEKKDTGSLLENSFDIHNFTADTGQVMSQANELAQLDPALMKDTEEQAERWKELQESFQERQEEWRFGCANLYNLTLDIHCAAYPTHIT